MFPDSDTAQKFSRDRMKTEAILNAMIAPHSVEFTHGALKEIQYSGVCTDRKIFPVTIQYFDWKKNEVN